MIYLQWEIEMTTYKYTRDDLEDAVKRSKSISETMRRLGIRSVAGGNHAHVRDRIAREGIDTSHFLGQSHLRGTVSIHKRPANEILVYNRHGRRETASVLRRALDEIGRERICAACGIDEVWNGKPLVLEIDHINDDFLDNRPENLKYLCPNCHQQKTLKLL